MRPREYPAIVHRYNRARIDLAHAKTAHEMIASPRTRQAVIALEAEYAAATEALREAQIEFARIDAARTGERIEI